jgi:hypothetical protein
MKGQVLAAPRQPPREPTHLRGQAARTDAASPRPPAMRVASPVQVNRLVYPLMSRRTREEFQEIRLGMTPTLYQKQNSEL